MDIINYPSLDFHLTDLADTLAKIKAEYKDTASKTNGPPSIRNPLLVEESLKELKELLQQRKRKHNDEEPESHQASTRRTIAHAATNKPISQTIHGRGSL